MRPELQHPWPVRHLHHDAIPDPDDPMVLSHFIGRGPAEAFFVEWRNVRPKLIANLADWREWAGRMQNLAEIRELPQVRRCVHGRPAGSMCPHCMGMG